MTSQTKPIGYLLKRAQHLMRLRMDELLAPYGLTAPQYAVMAAIQWTPGATGAALAREALVTAQTMGGLIQALEKAGYVERAAVEGNARRIANRLTASGADVLHRAHGDVAPLEAELVSDLDGASLGAVNAALVAIADRLASRRPA